MSLEDELLKQAPKEECEWLAGLTDSWGMLPARQHSCFSQGMVRYSDSLSHVASQAFLKAMVLRQGPFCPQRIRQCLGRFLVVTTGQGSCARGIREERPGMLPNVSQCTGKPSFFPTKNDPIQASAREVEKPITQHFTPTSPSLSNQGFPGV